MKDVVHPMHSNIHRHHRSCHHRHRHHRHQQRHQQILFSTVHWPIDHVKTFVFSQLKSNKKHFIFCSVDPNHAAMAAAFSHPFFLAAAAASSRDLSDPMSNAPRILTSSSAMDEHHPIASSPTVKRSLSPSKSTEDVTKKFSSTINGSNLMRPSCFTPNINPSLLSQVSKLKIIAKGKIQTQDSNHFLYGNFCSSPLENNFDQNSLDKSITLSIELNGIAYQGTLHATSLISNKD